MVHIKNNDHGATLKEALVAIAIITLMLWVIVNSWSGKSRPGSPVPPSQVKFISGSWSGTDEIGVGDKDETFTYRLITNLSPAQPTDYLLKKEQHRR